MTNLAASNIMDRESVDNIIIIKMMCNNVDLDAFRGIVQSSQV